MAAQHGIDLCQLPTYVSPIWMKKRIVRLIEGTQRLQSRQTPNWLNVFSLEGASMRATPCCSPE